MFAHVSRTKRLNEQVRRNADRFPADFLFQLTDDETAALRSQIATLETGRAFVSLRRAAASHVALARELEALKRSVATLDADMQRQFDQVYEAILGLMATSGGRQ